VRSRRRNSLPCEGETLATDSSIEAGERMRDLIEEMLVNQPLDPTEAARRSMQPQLRRRFYERAEIAECGNAFEIILDGRPVKTPARRRLAAPTRALAEAVAAEWQAQRCFVEPARMPLTRLANSIIDGVAEAPAAVAAEAEKYLASDLVYYRAEAPAGLVARQAAIWDPIIAWAREFLDASFASTHGMAFLVQPQAALAAAGAAIPRDPWRLGAFHAVTTLTGSALIALAVLKRRLSAEQAWEAAHVEEDWNMDFWGRDQLALERRALRWAEMQAAFLVLHMLDDSRRTTEDA
jgi:chaperone required for assembly of F1-ATPase